MQTKLSTHETRALLVMIMMESQEAGFEVPKNKIFSSNVEIIPQHHSLYTSVPQ
jgi:hypothetical protein